jgi:hypothetical protein
MGIIESVWCPCTRKGKEHGNHKAIVPVHKEKDRAWES